MDRESPPIEHKFTTESYNRVIGGIDRALESLDYRTYPELVNACQKAGISSAEINTARDMLGKILDACIQYQK